MELHFTRSKRVPVLAKLRPALLLCALSCAVSGLLGAFSPFAFLGVLPLAVLPFLPQKRKKWCVIALAAVLIGFSALRFSEILHGLQLLANRIFTLSEGRQSYEYDYFAVAQSASALREGIAFLSLAAALAVYFRGGLVLTALFCLAQAYFGITAPIGWLLLLLLAAAFSVFPQERLGLHGIIAALLLGGVALVVSCTAATPNVRISGWEEQTRDRLALHSIFYERTPERIEIPQEQTPPPQNTERSAVPSTSERKLNVLFLMLLLLTLMLLFVPAVVRDRARRKRERNRAGFDDPDAAAAIRAMYLHSRRWLRLKPEPVPQEIHALWLLAAYSDHPLSDDRRAQMERYLVQVERRVWQSATKRERLRIKYRLCL